MSWLFSKAFVDQCENLRSSQALEAEFSAESCSDGEPSVQLNVMPTARPFWRNDKTKDTSNLSRYGLTSKLLTDARGEELLTSFLEAFPVRTSAQPGKAQDLRANEAGCGKKWHGSLAKCDQRTRSWKTRHRSLDGDLIEFSETFPKWGTTVGGELYRLPMPSGLCAIRALITSAIESGLLLRAPTLTVHGNYNRKGASKNSGDGLHTFLTKRIRTLVKSDSNKWNNKTVAERKAKGQSVRLGNVVLDDKDQPAGGALNPTWCEWFMGFPIGWTELADLETHRFQQWLHSHGVC